MVKEVKELRAELDIHSFSDGSSLEHCEVEVDDALLPQGGVDTRLITKAVPCGVREATRVEPSRYP